MRNTVLITDAVRTGSNCCSKKEIQQQTNIAWGTMCKVVDSLLAQGYLFARKEEPQGRGRPMIPICINAESAYFFGLDIGASRTRVLICDLNFNVVYRNDAPTLKYSETDSFLKWIYDIFDSAVAESSLPIEKIKGKCGEGY